MIMYGQERQGVKNGKKEGKWVEYYENGQLMKKEVTRTEWKKVSGFYYLNMDSYGVKEVTRTEREKVSGLIMTRNGQLWSKGNYKTGVKER